MVETVQSTLSATTTQYSYLPTTLLPSASQINGILYG